LLKFVALSAAEAKLGALFLNAKEAKIMCRTLQELGHPQPPLQSTSTTQPLSALLTTPSKGKNLVAQFHCRTTTSESWWQVQSPWTCQSP
jgi:hypothetical protein